MAVSPPSRPSWPISPSPAPGACTEPGTLNTSVENYNAQLTAPLTPISTNLTSLDDLGNLARGMSGDAVRLSQHLRTVEGAYQVFEYPAAVRAMLRPAGCHRHHGRRHP